MHPAVERRLSGLYRGIFVDLDKVALCLAGNLPANARVLDIGGGDGELLNRLFERRDDLHVAMVDVAPSVGLFVHAKYRSRITLYPGTSVESHAIDLATPYDAVLVSDVMHHLPLSYRGDFLVAVHSALKPGGAIYVKDIQPGHFISWLSLMCDKYISGDRGVVLVSKDDLCAIMETMLPEFEASEVGLQSVDPPNYLLRLKPSTRGVPA